MVSKWYHHKTYFITTWPLNYLNSGTFTLFPFKLLSLLPDSSLALGHNYFIILTIISFVLHFNHLLHQFPPLPSILILMHQTLSPVIYLRFQSPWHVFDHVQDSFWLLLLQATYCRIIQDGSDLCFQFSLAATSPSISLPHDSPRESSLSRQSIYLSTFL